MNIEHLITDKGALAALIALILLAGNLVIWSQARVDD